MHVVVERSRDVSGNMPLENVYGPFDDVDAATEYAQGKGSENGMDRVFDVMEAIEPEPEVKPSKSKADDAAPAKK